VDDKLVNLLHNDDEKLAKLRCLRAMSWSTCYIMWITSWSPMPPPPDDKLVNSPLHIVDEG
jgi:hypothetical protein